MTSTEIHDALNRTGLRNTKERCAILKCLSQPRAWTAAELHALMPEADLSTIYRNLTALSEKEILQPLKISGNETHYELAGKRHHAHSICPHCKKVSCIPCPVSNVGDEHSLEIFVPCEDCRKA